MAKKLVAQMECDRCQTVWYVDYKEGGALPVAPACAVDLRVPGEPPLTATFDVLCEKCKTAVRNYLGSILKLPKEESEAKEEPSAIPAPPRRDRQGKGSTGSSMETAKGISVKLPRDVSTG